MPTPKKRGAKPGNQNAKKASTRQPLRATVSAESIQTLTTLKAKTGKSQGILIDEALALLKAQQP